MGRGTGVPSSYVPGDLQSLCGKNSIKSIKRPYDFDKIRKYSNLTYFCEDRSQIAPTVHADLAKPLLSPMAYSESDRPTSKIEKFLKKMKK
jgi:hypothetical protein